jgi:hypothetical protein
MQNSHTIYVTIGRNVGSEPMGDGDWAVFREDVKGTLEFHGVSLSGHPSSVVEFNTLDSSYQGVVEESAIFVMFDAVAGPRLRHDLALLAWQRRQQSIALVDGGLTEFIPATVRKLGDR